jgi:hypothetical protein
MLQLFPNVIIHLSHILSSLINLLYLAFVLLGIGGVHTRELSHYVQLSYKKYAAWCSCGLPTVQGPDAISNTCPKSSLP